MLLSLLLVLSLRLCFGELVFPFRRVDPMMCSQHVHFLINPWRLPYSYARPVLLVKFTRVLASVIACFLTRISFGCFLVPVRLNL